MRQKTFLLLLVLPRKGDVGLFPQDWVLCDINWLVLKGSFGVIGYLVKGFEKWSLYNLTLLKVYKGPFGVKGPFLFIKQNKCLKRRQSRKQARQVLQEPPCCPNLSVKNAKQYIEY